MSLFDDITAVYPELTSADFGICSQIILSDDLDVVGEYIAKWEYSKPLPNGMKVGKN
jgi:hypothetical protein